MVQVDLVERDMLKVVGFSITESLNNILENGLVQKMHEDFRQRLEEVPNRVGDAVYLLQRYSEDGWSPDMPYENIVGVAVSSIEELPSGMIGHEVPGGRFVKFLHKGPESKIHLTYDFINNWLESNKEYMYRPYDIEYWDDRYLGEHEDSEIDIYVPMV